jgi:hypothetical protein
VVICFSSPLKAASSTQIVRGSSYRSCHHLRIVLLGLPSGWPCDGIWASSRDNLCPKRSLCHLFRGEHWSKFRCRPVVRLHRLKECQQQCFRLGVCAGSGPEHWRQSWDEWNSVVVLLGDQNSGWGALKPPIIDVKVGKPFLWFEFLVGKLAKWIVLCLDFPD